MARTYLVDAFNLIHAVDELREQLSRFGPRAAGEALIGEVRRWLSLQDGRVDVVLVFDGPGPPPRERQDHLEVRFRDHRADDDLLELLERQGYRILVSADGELVRGAERRGCPVVRPHAFFRQLQRELREQALVSEREQVPDRVEVQGWLELFRSAPPPG